MIGYPKIDGFGPKIDVFLLGPKDVNDGDNDNATRAQADKSSLEVFRPTPRRDEENFGEFGPTSKEGSMAVDKAVGMAQTAKWALSLIRNWLRMDENVYQHG